MEDGSSSGASDYGRSSGSNGGRTFGGRRFSGPRPFRPSPVRVGDEYDVKIESLSKRGDSGVARVQGLVIFVADTNVGDNLKIRITKVGRGYATADVVDGAVATAAEGATAEAPIAGTGDISDTDPGA